MNNFRELLIELKETYPNYTYRYQIMENGNMFKYLNTIIATIKEADDKKQPLSLPRLEILMKAQAEMLMLEFCRRLANQYKDRYTIESIGHVNFNVTPNPLAAEEKKIKEVMAELNKIYAGQFKFDYKRD